MWQKSVTKVLLLVSVLCAWKPTLGTHHRAVFLLLFMLLWEVHFVSLPLLGSYTDTCIMSCLGWRNHQFFFVVFIRAIRKLHNGRSSVQHETTHIKYDFVYEPWFEWLSSSRYVSFLVEIVASKHLSEVPMRFILSLKSAWWSHLFSAHVSLKIWNLNAIHTKYELFKS